MITVEQLLEQHTHYDLGDGFAIGKVPEGWVLYWRAIAVDVRLAVANGRKIEDVVYYPDVISAVKAASNVRQMGMAELERSVNA